MHEYLFDVEVRTSFRVNAASAAEARRMVDAALNGTEANFGAWPDGEPIIGETRLTMRSIAEQDGEPVRNGDAR